MESHLQTASKCILSMHRQLVPQFRINPSETFDMFDGYCIGIRTLVGKLTNNEEFTLFEDELDKILDAKQLEILLWDEARNTV